MREIENVVVSDLAGLAKYMNLNNESFMKEIDLITKRIIKLERCNNKLVLATLLLGGALYFTKSKVSRLELKVNNLETINNFFKEDNKKEEDTLK